MTTAAHQIDLSTLPADLRMRGHWVRGQLLIRGLTFAGIARDLGVCRNTVRQVVRHPYPRIERAIAERLGLRPDQIWPERYAARARRREGSKNVTHAASLPKDSVAVDGKDRTRNSP